MRHVLLREFQAEGAHESIYMPVPATGHWGASQVYYDPVEQKVLPSSTIHIHHPGPDTNPVRVNLY